MTVAYKLAEQFSKFPAGRFRKNAKHSGEAFREDHLIKLADTHPGETIDLDLNGTRGFNPSFLEEAFGGLVRYHGQKGIDIFDRLNLITEDKSIKLEIELYVEEAKNLFAAAQMQAQGDSD